MPAAATRDNLRVSSLGAWYEENGRESRVFSEVSFEVTPGTIVGVFGPNGAGKTTLVRAIAGTQQRLEGNVSRPSRDGAEPRISMVPQSYRESFFDWASLSTNLILTCPSSVFDFRSNAKAVEVLRTELELDLDLKLKPRQCSGGMVQQAALMRAFVNDPDLILADEPFSALDVEVASHIRKSFRRKIQEEGIIAIIILHDLEDIVEVCDKVLVVSGKPFSTEDISGFSRAHLLENKLLRDEVRVEYRREETFLQIMKGILERKHNGGHSGSTASTA